MTFYKLIGYAHGMFCLFLKHQLKFLSTTENGKLDLPALQIVNYLHGTITSLDELKIRLWQATEYACDFHVLNTLYKGCECMSLPYMESMILTYNTPS